MQAIGDSLEGLRTEGAEAAVVRDFNPLTLPPSTTLVLAARQMRSRSVSAVLVTEGDARLVGIFTERDAISRVLAEGKDPVVTTLAEVMTNNPDAITPQQTDVEVVRLMLDLRCRHLPIVQGSKVVGIVSLFVPIEVDRDRRND